MKRSKKVVFVCHCLLNQNARAKTVAKCSGVCPGFIEYCIKNNYGIVPIDCPELEFEPLIRDPANKEHYDTKEARNISRKIGEKVIRQVRVYLNNDYEVIGVIGVEGSPTCGVVRTHITSSNNQTIKVKESGIFFEEFIKLLEKENLKIDLFDWDIQSKSLLKFEKN